MEQKSGKNYAKSGMKSVLLTPRWSDSGEGVLLKGSVDLPRVGDPGCPLVRGCMLIVVLFLVAVLPRVTLGVHKDASFPFFPLKIINLLIYIQVG